MLKRANALDQDTYFSKPGYTDDHDGKSKLDAEQAEINDQQAIVDDLKAKLADIESRARAAGPDAEPAEQTKKPKKPLNAGIHVPDKSAPISHLRISQTLDQPAPQS